MAFRAHDDPLATDSDGVIAQAIYKCFSFLIKLAAREFLLGVKVVWL